jgi:hypothetical protein
MDSVNDLIDIPAGCVNEDGSLKPGVQVIRADDGRVIAEGKEEANLHGKDETRFPSSNLKPGDELYLDEEFTGDYCEFRDCLLLRTRHKMAEALPKLSKRRLCLLREHLLQSAAYHPQFYDACIQISLIATRVLAGDFETDLGMEDTEFEMGDMTEEDEVGEGGTPSERKLDEWTPDPKSISESV